MRLRADAQAIAEQTAMLMGLPGRTEIDSAHRKIAELERHLRRMQRTADGSVASPMPAARPASKPTKAKRTSATKQSVLPAKAARVAKAKPIAKVPTAKPTSPARKPAASTAGRKR
jgi:hypothetical protein